jgi:hypothetical protein
MDILRNKKGRECDKQRASTATYDSMEIHHTETYKIGHRWDTTEENQHREYMETNTEQASDKDKCNTIRKTERQRIIRQEAKMEGFSLRNTNEKIEPFARIGEEIEWNETLKTELLELNLIKETTET